MREVLRGELNPLHGEMEKWRMKMGSGTSRVAVVAVQSNSDIWRHSCRPLALLKCRKVKPRMRGEVGWEKRGVGCKDNNKCGFYDLCNYRLQPEVGGAGLQESHCRNPWESRSRRVNSFLARLVFLSFFIIFFLDIRLRLSGSWGKVGKALQIVQFLWTQWAAGGGIHE